MRHALIIAATAANRALEQLVPLGFRSFDHSWTAEEALAAARCRVPDLVVVGAGPGAKRAVAAVRQLFAGRALRVVKLEALHVQRELADAG